MRGNAGKCRCLQQTQFLGARDGFGAPLHLQFVEDPAVIPLDRVQGEEKPLAFLTIRESFGQELNYFQLALAQSIEQGLGKVQLRCGFAILLIGCTDGQQFTDIVRHHPMGSGCGQKLRHRGAFVEKETDEAARPRQCQRISQRARRLLLFAMLVATTWARDALANGSH